MVVSTNNLLSEEASSSDHISDNSTLLTTPAPPVSTTATPRMAKSRNLKSLRRLATFLVTLLFWLQSLSWIPTSLHVLFLLTLGQWCWTTNLDILYRTGIDPLSMLKHRKGYSVAGNYGISTFMSVAVCLAAILYRLTGTEWADFGVFSLVFAFWILPSPWRLYINERFTAIDTLIASFGTKITLAEVVLCDLLTSYSRIIMLTVLEGVWMVNPTLKNSFHESKGRMNSVVDVFVPSLVALPFIIRFRQCFIEYLQSDKDVRHVSFWNACKYLTALPVIGLGYYMGEWANASKETGYKLSDWPWLGWIFWLWIPASLINATFSLYWDLVMDWHLLQRYSLLPSKRKDNSILRARLQFPRIFYFAAIGLNTVLRSTWILKCIWIGGSQEGGRQNGLDALLIVGEMFRRWVWVFFRLEREWFLGVSSPTTAGAFLSDEEEEDSERGDSHHHDDDLRDEKDHL